MALIDITTLTSQGITDFIPQIITYSTNTRNAFSYDILFLELKFDFESKKMTGKFRVIRRVLQNGILSTDISYIYESVATDTSDDMVDKNGNLVPATIDDGNGNQISNPNAWGTEFKYLSTLFSAPISDSEMVQAYQQILFDRGVFDFPKIQGLQ